ncbi:MAG TPA: penicillin-binding transpeptidase domain-containing protein [Polyangiaceae bacterium]|nr:penicillin-binding transpeptidase domain-containing protein [Polyangiaceae bacterium]
MIVARLASLAGLLVLYSCARPTPPAQSAAAAQPASAAAQPATTSVAIAGPRLLPELAKEFEAERVSGSIALYDTQDGVLSCSDVARCQKAVIPASTFKIPNSMIALETGVVEGPDTVLPWDRKQYQVENWNQDLKFRDAFRVSCVPCYQAIARKVGEAGERDWVEKLGYGNRNITGGVDGFWLWGELRISPVEQIDFLRRFDGNRLPISERTADIVRDMMALDVTETYVLRGKTGAARPPEEAMMAYWFVGWLELGERRVFFATLLDGHAADVEPLAVRRRVTERVLRARGLM